MANYEKHPADPLRRSSVGGAEVSAIDEGLRARACFAYTIT